MWVDLGWPVHPLNFLSFGVDVSYLMDCEGTVRNTAHNITSVKGKAAQQVCWNNVFFPFVWPSRDTEQATLTGTPSSVKNRALRTTWRSLPPCLLCHQRTMSWVCAAPSSLWRRNSREKGPGGSTHPTATWGSMFLNIHPAGMSAPGPRPWCVDFHVKL